MEKSFLEDTDGEGRTLFSDLSTKAAYEDVTYHIIRMLYFDQDHEAAGRALLKEAMDELGAVPRVYAFFHKHPYSI